MDFIMKDWSRLFPGAFLTLQEIMIIIAISIPILRFVIGILNMACDFYLIGTMKRRYLLFSLDLFVSFTRWGQACLLSFKKIGRIFWLRINLRKLLQFDKVKFHSYEKSEFSLFKNSIGICRVKIIMIRWNKFLVYCLHIFDKLICNDILQIELYSDL